MLCNSKIFFFELIKNIYVVTMYDNRNVHLYLKKNRLQEYNFLNKINKSPHCNFNQEKCFLLPFFSKSFFFYLFVQNLIDVIVRNFYACRRCIKDFFIISNKNTCIKIQSNLVHNRIYFS